MKLTDLQPTKTGLDSDQVVHKLNPKAQTNIGSGLYANVFSDEENDPGTVTKVLRGTMDLSHDGYFKYVEALAKNNRSDSNPYFPKIYNVEVLSDMNNKQSYKVEMERLQSFYELSSEELLMLGDKMFEDFGMSVRQEIKKMEIKKMDTSHWPHKVKLQKVLIGKIQNSLIMVRPNVATGEFISIKDPELKNAISILRNIVRKYQRGPDIHEGNVMVRRGPGGPHLVITDPFV